MPCFRQHCIVYKTAQLAIFPVQLPSQAASAQTCLGRVFFDPEAWKEGLKAGVEVHCIYANYAVWGGAAGGPEDDFFQWGWYIPLGRGHFLRCGCRPKYVPAAEQLDSSAVGIVQLVAHAAGESILCVRGGNAALHKLLLDFLFIFSVLYFEGRHNLLATL